MHCSVFKEKNRKTNHLTKQQQMQNKI